MTKEETIKVLQSIEDRAVDFPCMTACDWVAIAAAKRHLENSIDSLQEEPVSEDLDDAAYKFVMDNFGNPKEPLYKFDQRCFKAGAKWQKEQMMANTADAMIGLPYENKDGGYTHLIDVSSPLPVGNNKIAIIFKED